MKWATACLIASLLEENMPFSTSRSKNFRYPFGRFMQVFSSDISSSVMISPEDGINCIGYCVDDDCAHDP